MRVNITFMAEELDSEALTGLNNKIEEEIFGTLAPYPSVKAR